MKKILLLSLFIAFAFNFTAQNCSVNANINQTICANDAMLLTGASGGLFTTTANWVQVGGPGVSITSPTSLITGVTGFTAGTYTFRLRAKCSDGADVFDDVSILVKPITFSNAGVNLPASCPGTKTLSANNPGSGETGVWTIVGANNAGVTITTPSSPTSVITLGTSSTGTTTLRWTITNLNGCISTSTISVSNYGGISVVNAGPDRTLSNCYSSTQSTNLAGTYAGNGTGGQIGTWVMVSGPNYPTIANVNLNNTGISNLIEGTYVFRWTVTGSCVSGTDDVVINVPAATQNVTSVASSNQLFCSLSTAAVLTANPPTYANEVLTWTQTGGPASTIVNINNASTAVTGLNPFSGPYLYRVTITNTLTACTTSATANISFATTSPSITLPADVIGTCNQTIFSIPYTTAGGTTTQYSILSGPTGPLGYTNATSPLSLTLTTTGTYNLQLKRFSSGIECNTALSDINVIVSRVPSLSNGGTNQILGCSVVTSTLSGSVPTSGTGKWSQISGPNTALITNPLFNNTPISGLIPGVYIFRWSISSGPGCVANSADVKITVSSPAPTTSAAGSSQLVCFNSTFQLAGNAPLFGEVGTWSVTPSAGVTITSVNNPSTTVSGLSASTSYTFTWRIANACGTSASNVVFTTTSGQGASASNAGVDQCLGVVASTSMAGNVPTVGTGTWTTVSGPNSPTIVSPSSANTSITGLVAGTYNFLWSIGNGTCSVTRDTVKVTVNNSTTASNAGTKISVCGTSTVLAGNLPTVGTGLWTQLSGPGGVTIVTPTLGTTGISGLVNNGNYVFQWTISNGACSSSSSTVQVVSNTPPTAALAGPSQTICAASSFTLAGNSPSDGSGIWSQFGSSTSSGLITTPTLSNTSVTGISTGTYFYKWSISNGPLCPVSESSVTINVSAPTNAGSDINLCFGLNTQLQANAGAVGSWSLVSGPSTPSTTTNSSYSSVIVSNMLPGTYVYQFTSNSIFGCPASIDNVSIVVSSYATVPNAGSDQSICLASASSVTLAGNTPIVGTGAWSILTGPSGHSAIITSASNPSTTVTNMTTPGIYVLRWNISNGFCSNFSDVVRIEVARAPSLSNAGINNLTACATNFSLAANQPTSGIGVWSQLSGPSATVFDLPNQPNTTLSNLTAGTYQYVWAISTGTACPASTSTVSITFPTIPPTSANGGPDLNLCNASSAVMAGNVIATGTATWTSVAGPNTPIFASPNSPTSSLTGLTIGTYTVLWSSSNGACIYRDTVKIINSAQPNIANAGTSQTVCPFTAINLSANTPTTGTTGMWSYVSGPTIPVIGTPTNVTTSVLGTDVGTYVFRWTISSLNCPSSVSNVTIVVNSACPTAVNDATITLQNTPVTGNAAFNDLSVSGGTFAITTQPTNGTVTINPSTGQYTFTPTTGFSGITTATYNICNGTPSVSCSSATITYTVYPAIATNSDVVTTTPGVSTSGTITSNDPGFTSGVSLGATYTVSVTQPASTTGTIVLNPATGQYTFNPNPSFTGTATTTYTLCNITVTPSVCSTNTILIQVGAFPVAVSNTNTTMQNTPVSGNVGTNDVIGVSPVFTGGPVTPGTGTLTINPTTGAYTFTPATGFTGTTSATYTLCNVSSPPCSTTTITFTVFPTLVASPDVITTTPSVSVNGTLTTNDAGVVTGGTYSVSVTQPATSTGTIVINPATGQYTFNPNPTFTGTASTTYTICNTAVTPSVCSTTTILIQVGNAPVAVSNTNTTMQNTPVSGNVGTNDIGSNASLNPVFTAGAVTAGTGTLTVNPTTGAYSYTPAAGFTGTTVATYTLCNLLSPPCSTTTITFTVFPTLVANPDAIITTPSVTTTGTLTTNDSGVIPGGTYSVSVTQPSPSTGTIVINPATGQYTFNPNPAFTGTTSTTYTICNTAVTPSVCSTTTILIQVGNVPVAVSNTNTTMQNTPVSGNVGTNDIGSNASLNPVFTGGPVTPGTGTLTVNPTTGAYTYTPATGFTGTTVATYTLCNLLSPPCSTTTITFTVFPTLVANPDVIATTPSVTTIGTLTTNDLGVVTGGTYSVSVTPVSTTTGTLTVDPATGNYTFTPNPAFTGTASTTYTVCNTVVSPSVCSTSTILIIVSSVPVAVADGTTTIENTPVSGNVGTNDSGANPSLSPVFTGGPVTAGTGTLSIDPATGNYTFTPATGFTGTTSATYTLCNISSPPCSTTTITFTVFPTIVANPDVVVTTPSVTTTGTLTTNDLGVVTGGTYSVSVTPVSTTTGTLTVDPATGNYTFTPNPTFTGTVATTYTICNTAVEPDVCSTSTITIIVTPTVVAVADGTTTIENTPVSGSVATNDVTGLSPTFTGGPITAGTGTLTIDPATGNYTFTPAPGFTGTTSATYTLCNISSPPCSTTTITFTVFPTLVANPDVIATTPSVTTTGTLTTNDLGVVTGGTYSVSVTPVSTTTGTLTVDPATGNYTFTPDPAFTGTVTTTYTICNTTVEPDVCSTSTILIIVSSVPVAVSDATTTIENTPVSGNVGTNDSGANPSLSPVFTGGPVTAGTGTLSIDPATGNYTFTPATGFTGTTSATYTLCNISSPPCSTTTITFTVFPTLVANPDVVVTTPSVTTTGTLTTNDLGVVTGGTYSVSVTPVSTTTGTLTVDPATGNYTFTPNPTFTGTVATTYTICNTTVEPDVCSTSTITIVVTPSVMAVADGTTTVENTPVSGSVSTNDVTGLSPTFTGGPVTAGTGTLTIDPATGNYTFTPAPGFTGTTSATYTLCNIASPPCSTTTITFTVFPTLVANPDVIATTPSVTTTGTLTTNDLGVVTGGTYSVSVTPVSTTTGTLTVDPATGNYTFTPDPAFTGSVTTTYTICNTGVEPDVCSTSTITIWVGAPQIAAAKTATSTIKINPTTYQSVFVFNVTNLGNSIGTNVQLVDDLNATFPAPMTYTVVGLNSTAPLTTNAGYNGGTTIAMLSGTNSLLPAQSSVVTLTVNYSVNSATNTVLSNVGIASTSNVPDLTGGAVHTSTDVTSDGTNPDPNGNGNPNDVGENGPTLFGQQIAVSKSASNTTKVDATTYQTVFTFNVASVGPAASTNVQLVDNLNTTFPAPITYTVVGLNSGSPLTTNSGYNGNTNIAMLSGTNTLLSGTSALVTLTVNYSMNGSTPSSLSNYGIGSSSNSPDLTGTGTHVSTDTSGVGNNPDPNDNGLPGESGEDNPTPFGQQIGVAKSALLTLGQGNGVNSTSFVFTFQNLGVTPATNVQLIDDLNLTFPAPITYTVASLTAGSLLSSNATFNGNTVTTILTGTNTLAVGASETVTLVVFYNMNGSMLTSLTNYGVGTSSSDNGTVLSSDTTNAGSNPDTDGDGNPNEPTDNNPTPFSPAVDSVVVDFFIPQGFSPNGDGVNDVLIIRGITAFPNNKMSILNRWGNYVTKIEGYDNADKVWNGKASEGFRYGGDDLPEGTYFYILDLGNGEKPLKGYIYLNRSVK